MQTWRTERARRGNMLVLVGFLSLIVFIAIASIGFMSKSDRSTTGNLLRELHATHLAESIAAQVEAQANSGPWNRRFWLQECIARGDVGKKGQPSLNLNKGSPYVNLSGDSLPADEYEFAAIVKDVEGEVRQYRLYVEVDVRGEKYAFSWDKRWDQTLTTGMNRDATDLDKPIDLLDPSAPPGDEPVDKLIEGIKDKVSDAPEPEGANPAQKALLDELKIDARLFDATATAPQPDVAPTVPETPK